MLNVKKHNTGVHFSIDIDDPQPDGSMRWITDEINISKIEEKIE